MRASAQVLAGFLVLAGAGSALAATSAAASTPACPELPKPDRGPASLSPLDLDRLELELLEAGSAQCATAVLEWMGGEHAPAALQTAGAVLTKWDDPALLPPLYDLFAATMLEPRGSRYDAAYAAAGAIERLTPPGAHVLDPLRGGQHTPRWIQMARDRYVEEWGPAPSEAGRAVPPASDEWLADAGARFEACVASPELAPADPFDPLRLVAGPASGLAVGTRCASAAVLDAWRGGGDSGWASFVDGMIARYTGQGDYAQVAAALEARWGQGSPGVPWLPATGPWTRSAPPGPPICWLLLGVGIGLAALWLLLEARGVVGRGARSRALAVILGLGSIVALEGLLALLGVTPGDALRPLPAVSEMPGGGASFQPDARGVRFELPRPPGRVRLAVVGASSVVGISLAWQETIPAELQAALRDEVPCLEVFNQGRMGVASPGIRSLAVAAWGDLDADAVVIYTGHNEVNDMRELSRYVDIDPRRLAWRAAVTRTRLYGLVQGALAPQAVDDPGGSGELARDPEVPLDLSVHNPEFERRVTARFERELTDIARAARRQGVPLMLALPSFNHHGLMFDTWEVETAPMLDSGTGSGDGPGAGDGPGNPATVEVLLEALVAGDGRQAVRVATAIETVAEGHPTPRCLGALAHELAGDVLTAEDAAWDCARRIHGASSITPGVASAMTRVAAAQDLPLADAHAALHRVAGPHLPGYDLHIDSVHLNARGARAVAAEMAATMREAGWVERWQQRCDASELRRSGE